MESFREKDLVADQTNLGLYLSDHSFRHEHMDIKLQ